MIYLNNIRNMPDLGGRGSLIYVLAGLLIIGLAFLIYRRKS